MPQGCLGGGQVPGPQTPQPGSRSNQCRGTGAAGGRGSGVGTPPPPQPSVTARFAAVLSALILPHQSTAHYHPPPPPPSHSSLWGRRDRRWVKFTSLHKLFDITNKVKVYQKTTGGRRYYRLPTCSPCLETKNINTTPTFSTSRRAYQCAERQAAEVTQESPGGTQRGLQLTEEKTTSLIISHLFYLL